jgi:hypothetical protein
MPRELREETIRKALRDAGHGPAYCDTWGGDGLLGFYTSTEWRKPGMVTIGFGFGVGKAGRFDDGTIDIKAIRPVYLRAYAYALIEAGYTVAQDRRGDTGNALYVTR